MRLETHRRRIRRQFAAVSAAFCLIWTVCSTTPIGPWQALPRPSNGSGLRAFRLLHANADAKLIALGMTRYWMASDGISLDVAPFVAALECASRRKALVFGKPSAAFFHAAARRLGMPTDQILMIGDDIEGDV